MPRTKVETKTVWTFDELTDSAKEHARDWYRQAPWDQKPGNCEADKVKCINIPVSKEYYGVCDACLSGGHQNCQLINVGTYAACQCLECGITEGK